MDPNETLRAIREAIASARRGDSLDADDIMEHFEALDGWLSRGGFLPSDWRAMSANTL